MTNYRAGRPDKRGNNKDRAARKLYMLSAPQFGGDGEHVYCVHSCGTLLDYETVEADRIIPGGSYARNNVQPACRPCNIARSNDPYWVFTPPSPSTEES